MIIQNVLKGISGISEKQARLILRQGITCNWWRKVDPLPTGDIPMRLTRRNLEWHQNRYDDPDPAEGNEPFRLHTPFISTTAGTVERDHALGRNILTSAWQTSLQFATNGWTGDGCLFYCYLFVLGRQAIPHQAFSEEIRELNVYTGYSPYQPEGEITAKIEIPPPQIERFEYYRIKDIEADLAIGRKPRPVASEINSLFVPQSDIANIREFLV